MLKNKSIIVVIIGLIGVLITGFAIFRFYHKQNTPFKWKYKKELEYELDNLEVNSIDYKGIYDSSNGYILKFRINGNIVDDSMLFDTVKVFNTVIGFTNESSHPMYHKNFTIAVPSDKNYESSFLKFDYNYNHNSISVDITNSSVQDFFCLNDIEYTSINLNIVHDELFEIDNILRIKNIANLSIVDCYNIRNNKHNRIVNEKKDINRLKEKNPNISIIN